MSYTIRDRLTAVYTGQTPDRVPYVLDLSHYYYQKYKKPWILLGSYAEPEKELIDFNRKFDAGFYIPNQIKLFDTYYEGDVKGDAWIEEVNGNPETHWRLETRSGTVERVRKWQEKSYSWATSKYGIKTEDDIRVLAEALSARRYIPRPEYYSAWEDYVGEDGMAHIIFGLSAMGYFLHYWMGMENTLLASYDFNEALHDAVDRINANNLECIKMLMDYPGLVVAIGDNFSSDCQPPWFFEEWSAPFYKQAADIIHENGKKLSVHVDGKLRGSLSMIRDVGGDIIDAVTPAPMFDLTPQECREEAGDSLVLSGGVPPTLWQPEIPIERFEQSVMDWLEIRKSSPALVAAAGDQVPPGAEERRFDIYRQLIEEHGRY